MFYKSMVKIMNSWTVYFSALMLFCTNLHADNSAQDLKLFSDTDSNAICFSVEYVETASKIVRSIKPVGMREWGSNFIVSDLDVNVVAYNVKKDVNDNFAVGWVGVNSVLGIRSLYIRYYVKSTDTWSSIITVSSPTENLAESFTVSINTFVVEVVWTIYDEIFNIQKQSATYSL